MSRVESIYNRIRTNLNDQNEVRWPEPDIISSINEGILDFITRTKTLKSRLYIELEKNVNLYDVKDYAVDVIKVQFLNKTLGVKTEKDMTNINILWEDIVGLEVKYVIFDDLNKGEFKTYPRVSELTANIITSNSDYGALIDINTDSEIFNLINAEDIAQSVNKYLTVFIVKRPEIITLATIDSVMELDANYDTAIVFYVTGMLLRGDSDAQNRSFSAEQLLLYEGYVKNGSSSSEKSNNSINNRVTQYNGGFQ